MPHPYPPTDPPKLYDFADDGASHREYLPQATSLTTKPTESSHDHANGTNGLGLQRTSTALRQTRARLGLHPSAPIDEDHYIHERQQLLWSRIRIVLREPFAEFWGTFIMVMFGNGSVAQVLLSAGETSAPGKNGFGTYQSISWG